MARQFTPREQSVRRLWFNYRPEKAIPDNTLAFWVDVLEPWTDDEIAEAVDRMIGNIERKYFPNFAEFRALLPSKAGTVATSTRRSWGSDGSLTGDWSTVRPSEVLRIAGICFASGTRVRRLQPDVFQLAAQVGIKSTEIQWAATHAGVAGLSAEDLSAWERGIINAA